MTQNEALEILKTGANVFLTGEPGAGKTFTINRYIEYLKDRKVDHAITASTGIAATHIGGLTIHSWSGIGIRENLDKYDLDKISTNEYICRRIQKTKVLIIDEISMLHSNTLSMIDAVLRTIKQNGEPFGGMQIIFVGDFFQLPPIETKNNTEQDLFQNSSGTTSRFAYESDAWARLSPIVCYITEQHRQDDAGFLDLLLAIRNNSLKDKHHDILKSRLTQDIDFSKDITKLFSHNLNVDSLNANELEKMEEECFRFDMSEIGSPHIVASLKKGCLSPETLFLKKGAVVMCTKNNPKEGFVNGTLGTVIDFDEFSKHPIIKTKDGRKIHISPMDWDISDNGKIKAKITQLPLRLAWAITVHKSQGMSMDSAVMDLSSVFEYGQGYVALSRVRNLKGLHLLGWNDTALQVHPQILKQDSVFKQSSQEAERVFGALSKEELKKMHKNFIIAIGGKWKEEKRNQKSTGTSPLQKIREQHQNAYKKWTPEEELQVTEEFKSGKTIKEIAQNTGRQRGGIRSRLIKLGLIEEK